ncbi:MAG: hypothetical protein U5L73_01730 [Rhodoferax sp.]|uniref:hypothetical protein n=1 Tax=Rhodoferax sp. TaxID=50421 RepID=UPI002ACDAC46|nr:hypothetical protein [Rhodoferax sp.]MDZ7890459.1 hypothetical protein [Rhodoferax sp.]
MMHVRLWVFCLVLTSTLGAAVAAERDPTAPPSAAGVALPQGAVMDPADAPPPNMSVMVQNGVPYLVVGTRLVGVGKKVGTATVDRITETEVWLREGRKVRKLPRFAGIQRSVTQVPGTCDRPSAPSKFESSRKSAPKTARPKSAQAVTPVAPCTGTPP